MNIIELLDQNFQKHAEKLAVVFKDTKINFQQLREQTYKLAQFLKELGLKKGDTVGIYLPNRPEHIYSYLAIWCCGATAVPLDYMLTEDELVSCLSHAEIKILLTKPKEAISIEKLKNNIPTLKNIVTFYEKVEGCLFADELLLKAIALKPDIHIDEKSYAIIFYTSGTTGKPKGVLINYLQLGAPAKSMGFFVDLNEKDVILSALPFSHLGGLIYILNMLSFGLTMILMERFTPPLFLKNIQDYKVTCFWVVPSMYYAFLQMKEFESYDLSSLRWMVTFGASNSPEALRRFNKYCPHAHLLNGWGMTETNAPTTVIPLGSKNIESVGRPVPWAQVKIFDDEDKELPIGSVGEVVVKGWIVTDGYLKDPQLTMETKKNGWFHTGDLGKFDSEGNLYIVGRKKEMIKVSGEIVFEPEVEAVIQKHPQVAEVAVIGVLDKMRGEVPKAFVVLKEQNSLSKEDLRYFCREHLAHFKLPHYFEFVEFLPKNRVGKVDKQKLKSNS